MSHWSRILANRWPLSNNFCKACQNCLYPSFVIVHKAVRMHLILLCCESSHKCYHAAQTTPTWTKPNWHALQKWWLCSHPWPNMNELYNKLKLTYFVIMRWNQFCYISFKFEKLWVEPGFSFMQLNRANTIFFLTCLTKLIPNQSSVSQYAGSMCHMKEEYECHT